jgi:hypothetical protein
MDQKSNAPCFFLVPRPDAVDSTVKWQRILQAPLITVLIDLRAFINAR